jgi:hypothetical protein
MSGAQAHARCHHRATEVRGSSPGGRVQTPSAATASCLPQTPGCSSSSSRASKQGCWDAPVHCVHDADGMVLALNKIPVDPRGNRVSSEAYHPAPLEDKSIIQRPEQYT